MAAGTPAPRRQNVRDLQVNFRLDGRFGDYELTANVFNPVTRQGEPNVSVSGSVATGRSIQRFRGVTDANGECIIRDELKFTHESTITVVAAGKEETYPKMPGSINAEAVVGLTSEVQVERHAIPLTLVAERYAFGRAKYKYMTRRGPAPVEPALDAKPNVGSLENWALGSVIGTLAVLALIGFGIMPKCFATPLFVAWLTAGTAVVLLCWPWYPMWWLRKFGQWAEGLGANNDYRLVGWMASNFLWFIFLSILTIQVSMGQPRYEEVDCVSPVHYSSQRALDEDRALGIKICPEQEDEAWVSGKLLGALWAWLAFFILCNIVYIPIALKDEVARQKALWRQHRAVLERDRSAVPPEGISQRAAAHQGGKFLSIAIIADVVVGLIAALLTGRM